MTNGGLVVIDIDNPNMQIGQYYLSSNELVDFIFASSGPTLVRDNHQVYDDPKFQEAWQAYLLPELMRSYGVPTTVWLKTFASAPEEQDNDFLPFSLLMYYPSNSFMVEYEGNTVRSNGQIMVCAQQAAIALWLWPPETEMSMAQVMARGPSSALDALTSYRAIKEATGMSEQELTEFYLDEARLSNCLETPAELWP